MGRLRTALCIALLASIVSCASPPETAAVSVGALSGSDAVVALGVSGSQWVFYVCGGSTSFATMTRWFTGSSMTDANGAFDSTEQGWSVHGQHGSAGWSGTLVSPDGTSRTWTVLTADAATMAGLYSTVDSGCRTGVIVRQDTSSDAPSVQGTWCDDHGSFQQVTPIQPIALTSLGLHVQVPTASSARDLYVHRITLPLQ